MTASPVYGMRDTAGRAAVCRGVLRESVSVRDTYESGRNPGADRGEL